MNGATQPNVIVLSSCILDNVSYVSPTVSSSGNVLVSLSQSITASIVLSSSEDQLTGEKICTLTITGIMNDNRTVYNAWWIARANQNGDFLFNPAPTYQTTNNGKLSHTFLLTGLVQYTCNAVGLSFTYDGEAEFISLRAAEFRPPLNNSLFWG